MLETPLPFECKVSRLSESLPRNCIPSWLSVGKSGHRRPLAVAKYVHPNLFCLPVFLIEFCALYCLCALEDCSHPDDFTFGAVWVNAAAETTSENHAERRIRRVVTAAEL